MESKHAKSHQEKARRSKRKVILVITSIITTGMFALSLIGIGYLIALQTTHPVTVEQQKQTIASEGEVIADIAQKVSPSVVSILTEQKRTVNSYYGTQQLSGQAAGTGLIIAADGLVLTNKHVVPEGTSAVTVVASDGTRYSNVDILGRDPLNDLALLQIKDVKDLKPAALGDSDAVRTGQKVVAIGNALGQFQNTVTSGIISGVGRPVEAGDELGSTTEQLTNLFQTDAAINSGNSGGPLLNYSGEVIGINTAVAQDAQNIGFAIPINEAKGIITSAEKTGKISRPFLGVRFTTITAALAKDKNLPTDTGALVSDGQDAVVPGSPAEGAGLKPADIITKINNVTLNDRRPLDSVIGRYSVGDTVSLTVIRNGKTITLKATLSEAK